MRDSNEREPEADAQPSELAESFVRLLSEHDRALSIYVTGLVYPLQDAQDILQEGKIVMWRHFEKFTPGTNFLAWGRKILFHQILAYRRRMKHRRHTPLNEEILTMLNTELDAPENEPYYGRRERALRKCLTRLKPEQRTIIEMRYRDEASIQKISHHTQKTEPAIYQQLFRLRRALYTCIQKALATPDTQP